MKLLADLDISVTRSLPFLLLLVGTNNGLNITQMIAPRVADPRNNNRMQLECHYNMGAEELYAVKWYKDDNEFFRYTPTQPPYVFKFAVSGVTVLLNESVCVRGIRCNLVLTNLSIRETSGEYRCEVSSEAPAFRIASRTMNISIAALPDKQPKIENLAEAYQVGDFITANCISAPCNPAPQLYFYINNRQVPQKFIKDIIRKSRQVHRNYVQLESREIQIHLQLDRSHFNSSSHGKMVVGCASKIPQLPSDVSLKHQMSMKTVIITDRKIVNNEKYHWPMSTPSASSVIVIGSFYFQWALCILVRCVLY